MAGGKGGSTTTKVEIPKWLEDAAQANIARGEYAAGIGFTPYMGMTVAAPSQLQQASMANTGQAAGAFGLAGGGMTGMEGMPVAQSYGGVSGYSDYPIYQDALGRLQAAAPGQYEAIRGMFIDPVTGAAGRQFGAAPAATVSPAMAAVGATQYAPEGRGFDPSRDVPTGNFDGYAIADAIGGAIGGKNFGFGGMGPTGIFG